MFTEKKKLLAIFLGVLGWSTVAAVPTTAEIPDHLYLTGDPSRVLWVSAEASPNGRPPLHEIPKDASPEEQARLTLENESYRSVTPSESVECTRTLPWQLCVPTTFDIGTFDGLSARGKTASSGGNP